jgi:hypothetical protein
MLSKSKMPNHSESDYSDSEADDKFCHPFVMTKAMRLEFGCPPKFHSQQLVWSNKMRSGRASDETIRTKLGEFLRLHKAGESLKTRQDKIRDMWNQQYNTDACVFIACFTCADKLTGDNPKTMLKQTAVDLLIDENIPFMPWDIFQDFLHRLAASIAGMEESDLTPVNWEPDYEDFLRMFPFNSDSLKKISSGKKVGSSAGSAASKEQANSALKDWQLALEDARSPGLSQEQINKFADGNADDELPHQRTQHSPDALRLRNNATGMHDPAAPRTDGKSDANHGSSSKRRNDFLSDDERRKRARADEDDVDHNSSGLLAHEKFMRSTRLMIERSEYINFASMSKERLDKLHVLGVANASSKRLSTSTILVTTATEADVKVATFDFEAIASGFLFTYITLLSESSFVNANERVRDRLMWWQWLTGFFADNKPAAVKFIHWFMLEHHAEPFWLPVTKTQCVLLAIKAKDECQPISARTGASAPSKALKTGMNAANARSTSRAPTGLGTPQLTPSQTAKLVQWRTRFPGSCASRMAKEYTCAKEKRGLPCKFKHECVWCHSTSCKAACAQAEKL